jgi:DMSO/TMAO reductase YedYZ heme-binding membrane subunit
VVVFYIVKYVHVVLVQEKAIVKVIIMVSVVIQYIVINQGGN